MGQNFTNIFGIQMLKKKQFRCLMLGIDGAGKTAILYKKKLGQKITTIPTIGFNVQNIEIDSCLLTVWDVGGQQKIRLLWRHYYLNTSALIFVVDSSEPEKIKASKAELKKLLDEEQLKNSVLLVLSNKTDKQNAISLPQMVQKLQLNLIKGRQWYIVGTSAQNGDGIDDGFEWVAKACYQKDNKK